MNNAIKANIKSQDQTTFTRSVWQYDYGQILQITGAELPPAVEVQFSLYEKSGETITRVATTTDGVTEVQIPNELLKREGCKGDYFIYAYIFVSDEKSGNTKYKIAIAVKKRPKPEEPTDEPEQEENLFRATVVAVNAAADRAEQSEQKAKESAEKAETTLADMKETVGNLTETVERAEKLDGNLDKKLEQGENIVANIKDKLDVPENPMVGKYLRVKAVNEDGVPELEWVDEPSGGSSLDIQINGQSIVKDGIAEIPLCTTSKAPGLIAIDTYSNSGGLYRANNDTGLIRIAKASDNSLTKRENEFCPVVPGNLDYAVKCAMCDGKGGAWTAEEQAAARDRIGALSTQDMIDITDITMDAETLKYVFPSFADYRILEISFLKTYKATTGHTGVIWLRIANAVGWSIFPSYVYNTFTLDASGKSCIGKSIRTNNAQIETDINGLAVDKKYWNTEFREAPYLLLPNAELAQYYAECDTVIKVRGIKR